MPARRQAALALPRAWANSSTERRWRATYSAGSVVVRRSFVAVSGMAYPPVCYGPSVPYLQDMKVKNIRAALLALLLSPEHYLNDYSNAMLPCANKNQWVSMFRGTKYSGRGLFAGTDETGSQHRGEHCLAVGCGWVWKSGERLPWALPPTYYCSPIHATMGRKLSADRAGARFSSG
jgi:hypothetical protein